MMMLFFSILSGKITGNLTEQYRGGTRCLKGGGMEGEVEWSNIAVKQGQLQQISRKSRAHITALEVAFGY